MVLVDSESAVILRLRGPLELKCQLDSTDAVLMQKAISRTFEALRSQVKSEACVLAVCDSPVLLWPNKWVFEEITPDTPCEDIFQWIQTDDQETGGKRSTKKKNRKGLSAVSIPYVLGMVTLFSGFSFLGILLHKTKSSSINLVGT
ncbi:hypothetical protein XENOCAPTIV_001086 [Xenoophorus captivus]|uniref:UFSP2 second domain-containing protein n=1 Tax=Xenoophorus captivus TaxID=1517983 RepID=A0ABV0QCH2_9TELE